VSRSTHAEPSQHLSILNRFEPADDVPLHHRGMALVSSPPPATRRQALVDDHSPHVPGRVGQARDVAPPDICLGERLLDGILSRSPVTATDEIRLTCEGGAAATGELLEIRKVHFLGSLRR